MPKKRGLSAACALVAALLVAGAARAVPPAAIGISHAHYDPFSPVLKEKSYLQDAVGPAVRIG